jgi:hypothetical protein
MASKKTNGFSGWQISFPCVCKINIGDINYLMLIDCSLALLLHSGLLGCDLWFRKIRISPINKIFSPAFKDPKLSCIHTRFLRSLQQFFAWLLTGSTYSFFALLLTLLLLSGLVFTLLSSFSVHLILRLLSPVLDIDLVFLFYAFNDSGLCSLLWCLC